MYYTSLCTIHTHQPLYFHYHHHHHRKKIFSMVKPSLVIEIFTANGRRRRRPKCIVQLVCICTRLTALFIALSYIYIHEKRILLSVSTLFLFESTSYTNDCVYCILNIFVRPFVSITLLAAASTQFVMGLILSSLAQHFSK